MTDSIDDAIASGCAALDLTVDPAWHAAIRFNYETSMRLARLVCAFELPDETDPAPVFVP